MVTTRATQHGFTLMEVLVAVAVLAIALAAAIRIGAQTAGNTIELRDRTLAGWVAENVLAEVQSGLDPIVEPTQRSGTASQGFQEWDWELSATQAEIPVGLPVELPDLLELEVMVYRGGESERPVSVRTTWYQATPPAEVP